MSALQAGNRSLYSPTRRSAVGLAAFAALAFAANSAIAQDIPASPQPHIHTPRSQKSFEPAAVFAKPGLTCKVHPTGDAAKPVTVYTDSDGYARFYAVRAAAGDAVRELTMDCTDEAGKLSKYPVDLTSEEAFVPRPLDLEREPGVDRQALSGDPMAWSQDELLKAGYGLRPDPATSPDAYQRWLAAATLAGRMLTTHHAATQKAPAPQQTVRQGLAPYWTGTTISGKPNYISVEGNISVPKVIPNGDETKGKDVHVAVWNGLDSATSSGLIQGGYQIDVSSSIVSVFTFREYCCGNPNSNGYKGDFNLSIGDTLYSEEWYCDANGKLNLNGGYGCTHLHDLTSGAVLDCSSASSKSCWSVPALPLCSKSPSTPHCMTIGGEADAVIELQGALVWPDISNSVSITGSAYSSQTKSYSQTVTNDPVLTMLTDFTGTNKVPESTSHMGVSIGPTNQTYFTVSQFLGVSGLSHGGTGNQVIAVGPNGGGSTLGDPYMLGHTANQNGDYSIYQWVNGAWSQMPGAGTQIAVSPSGVPWVVNHAGRAFYYDSGWQPIWGTYCASHIAVGSGGSFGTAWTLGCTEGTNGYNIYKLVGSNWVQQAGQAISIAVGASNKLWIVEKGGKIYSGTGSGSYTEAPGNACATAIAAAPISPYSNTGDVWTLGCHEQSPGYEIYQLQGNSWVNIPGYAASISISPDHGIPWIVESSGGVLE